MFEHLGWNMPPVGYVIAVLVIMFVVTFCLRALPFAMLKPLRNSKFISVMALWMPAGILGLLAAAIFQSTIVEAPEHWWKALIATAVTIASHLAFGRRTLLSIGLGTACYVVLVNFI